MSVHSASDHEERKGIRIDARTGESKALGIRNAHKGMGGQIIGGVDRYGRAFGTKLGNGTGRPSGPAPSPIQDPTSASTPAAQTFGPSARASQAQTSDQTKPATPLRRYSDSSSFRPAQINTPAQDPLPIPENLTNQVATNTPGESPAGVNGGPRINRLTGKPFGYLPDAASNPAGGLGRHDGALASMTAKAPFPSSLPVPSTLPIPSKLTKQIATNTPGALPTGVNGKPKINRLTGKPFGYLPS